MTQTANEKLANEIGAGGGRWSEISKPDRDRIASSLRQPAVSEVTDEMIQAACVAGYGVDTDKDSNLYKVMKRALGAALTSPKGDPAHG